MALSITGLCVNCEACLDICPAGAVVAAKPYFRIDAAKCTECDGHFAAPQCATICPVEAAILDSNGAPLNPPGSLTGIPPERLRMVAVSNPKGDVQ